MYETTRQVIDLTGTNLTGRILDIGGGGEGVIAQLAGENVIAIDNRPEELMETPDIGLKIVMDACKLQFLDHAFDGVTAFFSLMYMNAQDMATAIQEAYRVLKPGGALHIWDITIPSEITADIFLAHTTIKINPALTITPSYGIGWHRGHSAEGVRGICTAVGFTPVETIPMGEAFYLHMVK